MNLKRFTARTSREALALVKAAFGEDAVVMSTKPCAEGVEMLAMAPESVSHPGRSADEKAYGARPPAATSCVAYGLPATGAETVAGERVSALLHSTDSV